MTAELFAELSAPVGAEDFARLAEPLRRELKLHCYRMLGSLHEAEDLVQETYLRAWRNLASFQGRGSFRAWLYQIATNACLNALRRRRGARILPDRRTEAASTMPDGSRITDVAWLEPYPDAELEAVADPAPSPEARYASQEAVRLAFVAVIQELPPRQRAALLLCDILGWSAAETATLLGGSVASINSALQRARATLARRNRQAPAAPPATDVAQAALLERYLAAWERLDVDGLAAVLKEDAIYTMPPVPQWYRGRDAIRAFFAWAWPPYHDFRLIRTGANGQPAFAAYARDRADADWTAHSLHVLELEGDRIANLTLFSKPLGPQLIAAFGLPAVLAAGAPRADTPGS